MFQGSQNVSRDSHGSMIASVGGESNAYTTEDATVFWETVPRSICRWRCGSKPIASATLDVDEELRA